MKRLLCWLMTVLLILTGIGTASAAETDTTVPLESLTPGQKALYESEMASALANARSRAPGQSRLVAEVRGDFNGYTGSKADNSLRVEFRVTDSVVEVGEKVTFYVTMTWDYGRLTYIYGGQVMDEDFNSVGTLVPKGDDGKEVAYVYPPVDEPIPEGTKQIGRAFSVRPQQPGYFNYVIILKDGNGNMLALTTPTIQVYDGEIPTFDSIGTDTDIGVEVDNNLAMRVSLDRTGSEVGDEITATATFSTMTDPVSYRAEWYHTDVNGNALTPVTTTGQVNASGQNGEVSFPYKLLSGGEVQFRITATDGDGNQVAINSPWLTVKDGFYFTARFNRVSAMKIGDSVTATYQVYGHECDTISYYIGWECYDGAGNTLTVEPKTVEARSGKESYTPRTGQGLEFYIGAICDHISGAYPARVTIALVGGMQVDLSLTDSTVKSGETIGLNYSIDGGVTPYQQIVINGYSYDVSRDKKYNFFTQTVTAPEGTVYGRPYLGDSVYYSVKVVEADGNVSSWDSPEASLTGAPEVTTPVLTASLDAKQIGLGESIILTWKMSGGSGTLDDTAAGSSVLRWKTEDGTVVKSQEISKVTGSAAFTPENEGSFYCELVLTDGYNQRVTWTSECFTVTKDSRVPGDADANGSVTIHDALLIMQYDAGWSVSINKSNADCDGSGQVDMQDALLILRYGAGENVVLQ